MLPIDWDNFTIIFDLIFLLNEIKKLIKMAYVNNLHEICMFNPKKGISFKKIGKTFW